MARSEPGHADARCTRISWQQSLGGKQKVRNNGDGETRRPTATHPEGTPALPVRASGARRRALWLIAEWVRDESVGRGLETPHIG